MTTTVTIQEIEADFSQLLRRVRRGEEIVIAESGQPVARLVPFTRKPKQRKPGSAQGQIWIAPDFNAPLPDELLDAFEGKS